MEEIQRHLSSIDVLIDKGASQDALRSLERLTNTMLTNSDALLSLSIDDLCSIRKTIDCLSSKADVMLHEEIRKVRVKRTARHIYAYGELAT